LKTKFRLEFAPRFERRFKDLDQQTQIRILREVQILTENPHAGKALKGQWEGTYSFRIGAFRIVYLISQDRVVLLTVGHRKDVPE
jgi:mRNA-degrading endonuclease RelE of RelBE toxin-antitoxin system